MSRIFVGTSQVWKSFMQENFGLIFRTYEKRRAVLLAVWCLRYLHIFGGFADASSLHSAGVNLSGIVPWGAA